MRLTNLKQEPVPGEVARVTYEPSRFYKSTLRIISSKWQARVHMQTRALVTTTRLSVRQAVHWSLL